MTKYNDGDLVEAVKGETRLTGRLAPEIIGSGFGIVGMGWPLDALERDGFTLTVIEKAAPKNVLPTETGWYLDRYHRAFHFNASTELYWWGDSQPIEHVDRLIAPFTRLEPVPVTAKKVYDSFRKRFGSIDFAMDFEAIAREFGIDQ